MSAHVHERHTGARNYGELFKGLLHYPKTGGDTVYMSLYAQGNRAQRWRITSLGWRVLLLMALAAHGAFAQKVTVEFDQSANFSKYKSFAIRDGRLNSKNP